MLLSVANYSNQECLIENNNHATMSDSIKSQQSSKLVLTNGSVLISLKDLQKTLSQSQNQNSLKKTTIILTGGQKLVPNDDLTNKNNMIDNQSNIRPLPLIHNQSDSSSNAAEMVNAIEELRRENERIIAELGSMQDLLDLFEQYRQLIHQHMDVCICAGRDHFMNRWQSFELKYHQLMPIKCAQLPNHQSKTFRHSIANAFETTTLSSRMVPLRCGRNNGDVDVTIETIEAKRANKSIVRSFLDRINPVDQSKQRKSNNISFTAQGSNVLIQRKRNALDEIFLSKNNGFKQARMELESLNEDSLPVEDDDEEDNEEIVTQPMSPDREEERLDQLNNALDQILMGRFDALNQLQPLVNTSHLSNLDRDEEEEEENNEINHDDNLASQTQNGQANNNSSQSFDDNNDSNEDSSEEEEDDDVIFVDESENGKNLSQSQTENSIKTNKSTILSTVLRSGLKPYNNFHQISSGPVHSSSIETSETTPIMNSATIKIYPLKVSPSSRPHFLPQQEQQTFLLSKNDDSESSLMKGHNFFQKRPHLTNEERSDIINRLKRNESGARIARDYGITKQAVSAIKRRAQMMGDQFQVQNNGQFTSRSNSPSVTINVSAALKNCVTPSNLTNDNSLVSRQLKQQKVNATIIKQSTLLAQLPRSTCDLVLPVNPVAIIKNQMANHQQQQLKSSTSSGDGQIENKRLILPRLLQGTDTYTPIYSSSNEKNIATIKIDEEDNNEIHSDNENHRSFDQDEPYQTFMIDIDEDEDLSEHIAIKEEEDDDDDEEEGTNKSDQAEKLSARSDDNNNDFDTTILIKQEEEEENYLNPESEGEEAKEEQQLQKTLKH